MNDPTLRVVHGVWTASVGDLRDRIRVRGCASYCVRLREFLLLLAALAVCGLGCGCVAQAPADTIPDSQTIPIDIPQDSPGVTLTVSGNSYAEIQSWLGESNSVTLSRPHKIVHSEISLDLAANTATSWQCGATSTLITFSPRPKITSSAITKLLGLTLTSLQINSDGSGVATVDGFHRGFRWDGRTGSAAAPNELPEVWAYSQPGCVPCVRAKLELAAEKDLPFRVVWKDDAAPEWLQSRPAFWWHTSAEQPSQKDVNNTRQATGWNGIKDFTERWKASRSPRKFQRTKTNAISYHAGHDCPSCGREQYDITNNNGPAPASHIHRCDHCSTSWYHSDQNSHASAGKSRQFLWWSY